MICATVALDSQKGHCPGVSMASSPSPQVEVPFLLDASCAPEERLHQAGECLRAIAMAAQDAILMMDPQGRISFWNPAATRLFGYEATEVLGSDLHDLLAPARFHPGHQKAMEAFRMTGHGAAIGRTLDLEARHRDGHEIAVQLSLSAVRVDNGWHAVGIVRDVTDQRRLARDLERLAAFPRHNPNPVLEFSATGDILYANTAFTEMAEAYNIQPPEKMLPPETSDIVRGCLTSGLPKLRVEITVGSRVWSWSFFPVLSMGTVHAYGGDVTERQRAQEALRQSEARFRALFEGCSDAVMLITAEGCVDCNSAALTMFGLTSREHIRFKHPAELSPPTQPDGSNSRTAVDHYLATALQRGSLQFEWIHRRLDTGVLFPAEVRLSAVEVNGQFLIQALVHDITARREREKKLRQLSAAVEQCPASIVITDPNGAIEYVNPKFEQVTGYSLAEVLGQNPRLLKSGRMRPEVYEELWRTITAGCEWRGEFLDKGKDGQLFWESASISPIRDPAGRITHFVAVKEDITERKKAESEREMLIKSLEEALANVKSLSGLLPICAGCKQIRDDQGYWTQVESYIQKHSEARFSHGLCPACIKKYYGELGEPDPDQNDPEPCTGQACRTMEEL